MLRDAKVAWGSFVGSRTTELWYGVGTPVSASPEGDALSAELLVVDPIELTVLSRPLLDEEEPSLLAAWARVRPARYAAHGSDPLRLTLGSAGGALSAADQVQKAGSGGHCVGGSVQAGSVSLLPRRKSPIAPTK